MWEQLWDHLRIQALRCANFTTAVSLRWSRGAFVVREYGVASYMGRRRYRRRDVPVALAQAGRVRWVADCAKDANRAVSGLRQLVSHQRAHSVQRTANALIALRSTHYQRWVVGGIYVELCRRRLRIVSMPAPLSSFDRLFLTCIAAGFKAPSAAVSLCVRARPFSRSRCARSAPP